MKAANFYAYASSIESTLVLTHQPEDLASKPLSST
jgi:hypothetical protein